MLLFKARQSCYRKYSYHTLSFLSFNMSSKLYLHRDDNRKVPTDLNFGKYVLDGLQRMGYEVALVNATTGEELTYRELAQYSVNLASSLMRLGIGKGDIVAIGSEKRNAFVPIILGIILTGATCTPYYLCTGNAPLRHNLSLVKPTHLICSKSFWEQYEHILKSCDSIKSYIALDDTPHDAITVESLIANNVAIENFQPAEVVGQTNTALILYSTGTTGMPKGVRLTHFNCIINSWPESFGDESIQTIFIVGEWYHNYDIFMTYITLSAGKKLVYVDDATFPNILECIEKYQVNMAMFVPYVLILIIKEENLERFNLDSLKIMYSGASILHENTIKKVKLRLPKLQYIFQGYGMTECGEPTSERWAIKGPKPGSVGVVAPGVTIKIVDLETNKNLGPNQHGEIRVKGPMLMKEYIGIHPSTYLDEEGFFKTGDVGYYDSDEYLYIVDRIKDIINNIGYKVAPFELEMILETHQHVLEAGVVGKPDPVCGELPAAFVVQKHGAEVTEQELLDYVHAEVAPYMQLTGGLKFMDKLPRSSRGKILRRNLREMLN